MVPYFRLGGVEAGSKGGKIIVIQIVGQCIAVETPAKSTRKLPRLCPATAVERKKRERSREK
jgi:hypothetical protein